MEDTNFNLKSIVEFENELKDKLKAVKTSIPLINNKFEAQQILCNKLEKLALILFGINYLIPGKKLTVGITTVLLFCMLKIKEKLGKFEQNYNNYVLCSCIEELDETIDSLELLKDFLRNKHISLDEKIQIIQNLYTTYESNLDDILYEIEEESNSEVKIEMIKK